MSNRVPTKLSPQNEHKKAHNPTHNPMHNVMHGRSGSSSVLQVESYAEMYNPVAPFERGGIQILKGTGFFVQPTLVITAAHLISSSFGVRVRMKTEKGMRESVAQVVSVLPDIDVAVLDTSPLRGLPLQFDDGKTLERTPGSAATDCTLELVGFSKDNTKLKTERLAFEGFQRGMIAFAPRKAVDVGFCGAPVLCRDRVVGICVSAFDPKAAKVVVLAQPISVFLAALPLQPFQGRNKVIRLPGLGILFHPYDGEDDEKSNNNNKNTAAVCQGVAVQWVAAASVLKQYVSPGDVLCGISLPSYPQMFPIDQRGNVTVRGESGLNSKSRIPLGQFLRQVPVDTTFRIHFRCQNNKQFRFAEINPGQWKTGGFDFVFFPMEPLEYEIFSGLVVMPLRQIHFLLFPHLLSTVTPDEKEKEHLIVTHILPASDVAQANCSRADHSIRPGSIIDTLNGLPVRTMTDYRQQLVHAVKSGASHLVWVTKDGAQFETDTKRALAAEKQLLQMYKYPKSVALL